MQSRILFTSAKVIYQDSVNWNNFDLRVSKIVLSHLCMSSHFAMLLLSLDRIWSTPARVIVTMCASHHVSSISTPFRLCQLSP